MSCTLSFLQVRHRACVSGMLTESSVSEPPHVYHMHPFSHLWTPLPLTHMHTIHPSHTHTPLTCICIPYILHTLMHTIHSVSQTHTHAHYTPPHTLAHHTPLLTLALHTPVHPIWPLIHTIHTFTCIAPCWSLKQPGH